MPEDIKVDKTKFDALLSKIARTPALKENERKVGKKKPKGKKSILMDRTRPQFLGRRRGVKHGDLCGAF